MNAAPAPGVAVGGSDDVFEVFSAGSEGAPIWRYVAKDGLKAPGMVAVGKFREAVEEAEQAAKQQSSKSTPKKNP